MAKKKVAVSVSEPINLANKDENYRLYNDNHSRWGSFLEFVQNPEVNFDYIAENGAKIVRDNFNTPILIRPDGTICGLECYDMTKKEIELFTDAPFALMLKSIIINNGDTDIWGDESSSISQYSQQVSSSSSYKMMTVSFDTVAHLFGLGEPKDAQEEKAEAVINAFMCGTLLVLDFVEDETIALTEEQKAAIVKYKKVMRSIVNPNLSKEKKESCSKEHHDLLKMFIPPAGFMLVGSNFHRPATSIIFNTKTGETGLFGMDGDSYFGSILPKKAKTVAQAYEVLIPKEAKGKDFKRQGEWFFILVDPKDQIRLTKKANNPVGVLIPCFITLPLERADSNPHVIDLAELNNYFDCEHWSQIGRDWQDDEEKELLRNMFNKTNIVVERSKSVEEDIYVRNFECRHFDHDPVGDTTGAWRKVVRNTAIRSVSAVRMVD